jgi:hypothetical protein
MESEKKAKISVGYHPQWATKYCPVIFIDKKTYNGQKNNN